MLTPSQIDGLATEAISTIVHDERFMEEVNWNADAVDQELRPLIFWALSLELERMEKGAGDE